MEYILFDIKIKIKALLMRQKVSKCHLLEKKQCAVDIS
jgi:hypothetical protein